MSLSVRYRLNRESVFALLPLILIFLCCSPAWAKPRSVTIVSSKEVHQYREAIEGFEKYLRANFQELELNRYFLDNNGQEKNQVMADVERAVPELYFALGSMATQVVMEIQGDTPMVATILLDDSLLSLSKNSTGVILDFGPEVQISWLKRFFPGIDRVVIMYNQTENSQRVKSLSVAAKKAGIEVEPLEMESATDLPVTLKSLGRKGDVLLGIPDKTVYSERTAKAVLLSTFRNRVPFVALSPSWVKAGALYSLGWDYGDLGRQSAELAQKILAGTPVSTLPPVRPAKATYVINLKTVEHLRLSLDKRLIEGAEQIFQ